MIALVVVIPAAREIAQEYYKQPYEIHNTKRKPIILIGYKDRKRHFSCLQVGYGKTAGKIYRDAQQVDYIDMQQVIEKRYPAEYIHNISKTVPDILNRS